MDNTAQGLATKRNRSASLIPSREELLELDTQRHFVSILWPLWAERRRLGRVALVAAVLSAAVAFLIRKTYESEVQMLPPQNSNTPLFQMMGMLGGTSSGGTSTGAASMASDLLGLKTTGAMFVAMLQSRT